MSEAAEVVTIVAASPEIVGGQGVQAQALVSGLRGDGCDVRFLPIDVPFPRPLSAVRRRRYVRTLLNQALYIPSLRRLSEADVVHVFSASYWSFLLSAVPALVAGRVLGRRVVLHYHSGEAADHLARWGALVHPWLRLADCIVVPSVYLQQVFARHGYAARVIRNVVDTRAFTCRPRRPLRPRLVCNRGFERHYRVEDVITAYRLVRSRRPDATLTLAGGGPQEAQLRRRAAGVPGVRFVGNVPRADLPRLLDDADIFVSAASIDNQPVSILEAFAAGLPVVATAVGDVPAMALEGRAGLLVRPRDPAGIATAVFRLLDDASLAAGLAERGRQEAARYSWRAVAEEWRSVYAEAGA